MEFPTLSDENIILAPIVLFILLVVIRHSLRRVLRTIRANRIKSIAETLQLPYQKKGEDDLYEGTKRRKKIDNVMTIAKAKIPFRMYDYRQSRKKGRTIYRTVALFESEDFRLPNFILKPTRWENKVNAALGMKDINFEDAPIFSKSYFLEGAHENAIRGAFSHQTLTFFSKNKGWRIEVKRGELLISHGKDYIAPSRLETYMKEVQEVAMLFKSA